MHAAEERVREAEIALLDIWDLLPYEAQQEAADLLHQAKESLEAGRPVEAAQQAALAQARAIPPLPIHVRALYYAPGAMVPAEASEVLDRVTQLGINTLFLNPFSHKHSLRCAASAAHRPASAEADPLQTWVEACAACGMGLHLWLRPQDAESMDTPLAGAARQGGTAPLERVPPATSHSSSFVARLKDLLTTYPIQGVHWDLVDSEGQHPAAQSLMEIAAKLHEWKQAHRPELLVSVAIPVDIDMDMDQGALSGTEGSRQWWLEASWIDLLVPRLPLAAIEHGAKQLADLAHRWGKVRILPRLDSREGVAAAGQVAAAFNRCLAEGFSGAVFAFPDDNALNSVSFLRSPGLKTATPWDTRASLASFAAWVIEGMNRWVAEDLLPNETALDLDEMAHDVAHWLAEQSEDGQNRMPPHGTARASRWLSILRTAYSDLDSLLYERRGRWLRRQIALMIDALERWASTL